MTNGKPGDSPVTDLALHGAHPFPPDIEALLLQIETLGSRPGIWPLGENWPFSPRELRWARGDDLDAARRDLTHLVELLQEGRGDEVPVDPMTGKPLSGPRPDGGDPS